MHSYMVRYNQPRVEEALTQLKAGSAQTWAVGPLENLGGGLCLRSSWGGSLRETGTARTLTRPLLCFVTLDT